MGTGGALANGLEKTPLKVSDTIRESTFVGLHAVLSNFARERRIVLMYCSGDGQGD
jgi:hypothetical protein